MPRLCILVALAAEAQLLIQHYKLKRDYDCKPFALYQNQQMALVVSGIGTIAAASACTYLHANMDFPETMPWLNVGIAGAAELNLGELYLVNKVTDANTDYVMFPPLVCESPCARQALQTVSKVSSDYPINTMVDMEAWGFYQTAKRFSTAEIVHSLKIISDNHRHPLDQISTPMINELIESQLTSIVGFIEALSSLGKQLDQRYKQPELYTELIQHYRFSQSQRNQLKQLLRCISALPEIEINTASFNSMTSKQILSNLEQKLELDFIYNLS